MLGCMESEHPALPRIARGAFWLAVVMAILQLITCFFNPVPGLLQTAFWVAFAIGIRNWRPWAAIAAALFILIAPLVAIVRGGIPGPMLMLVALFCGSIALVMFMGAA